MVDFVIRAILCYNCHLVIVIVLNTPIEHFENSVNRIRPVSTDILRIRHQPIIAQKISSSSSHLCAGQRLTLHNRTLEVRPGRITKKLELKYDYDCERDDTKSLLGVLMLGMSIYRAQSVLKCNSFHVLM